MTAFKTRGFAWWVYDIHGGISPASCAFVQRFEGAKYWFPVVRGKLINAYSRGNSHNPGFPKNQRWDEFFPKIRNLDPGKYVHLCAWILSSHRSPK